MKKRGARVPNLKLKKILPNSKRSLSEVITSLIIILLVLVAIGIVWIVTKNILNESSEKVTIAPLTNNVKIDDAKVGLVTANVKITRTQGDANITSLKFIFSDGTKTYEYEQKNPQLNQLETKTYEIPLGEGIKPTSVKVVPVFGKTEGTEVSEITPTQDLTSKTNNGLVAYYKFEGNAKDLSGNGNDGTCSGTTCPTYTNGKVGSAVNLDGIDDYINILDNPILDFGAETDFTLSLWINRKDFYTEREHLIRKGLGGFSQHFFIGLEKNKILTNLREYKLVDNSSNPADSVPLSSASLIEQGKWIFIAATFDRNDKVKIYVNNVLENEASMSQIGNISNNKILEIGSVNEGTSVSEFFNGKIDELIIFNRSLSADEINQIYDSQK